MSIFCCHALEIRKTILVMHLPDRTWLLASLCNHVMAQ